MRLLMLLLLALPAPLLGQAVEPDHSPEETVTLEMEAPEEAEAPSARTGASIEEIHAAPSTMEAASSAVAAQPTMRNFLYQVFLAAVTALITALIWKAVF
jgi:hypothetical protein